MGASYMTDPIIFLIDTLSSLYILAIVLRFLLQWSNADFYNPISQFLVKVTHPPLKLLRRFVPSVGKIDTSSIVLALGIQMLANLSIYLLSGVVVSAAALIILSFSNLLNLLLNVFVFAVLARVILSWFDPDNYNPAVSILYSLTEPLLSMFRKVLPQVGGFDFSPLMALIFLPLVKMMVLPPLNQLAVLVG